MPAEVQPNWVRTGTAARMLGMSREVFVRMLREDKSGIRWTRSGPHGHRRVSWADVLAYKQRTASN